MASKDRRGPPQADEPPPTALEASENHYKPVVGLGQASLDFLGIVPRYPPEDAKCELLELKVQGGGPAATAIVTLSRLGVQTAFIGAVGDDEFGPLIRQGLIEEGVDVSRLITAPGGTSQLAFIAVEPSRQTRTIFWHAGMGTGMSPEKLDLDFIRRARLIHLDGLKLEASLMAARTGRDHDIPVVFDAGTLRQGYLELVRLTHYLICSERFFRAFYEGPDIKAGLKKLRALGPTQAVVTMGREGSHGFDGKIHHHQPACQVLVLDTTGAGDVYHGAYIYGILAGWDMPECMRFASAAAALKCTRLGGRSGIPKLEELQAFLAAHSTMKTSS
ncbi:MAG: PfkB family carbohydrate kinase [Pseudomonadota bacterium]